MARAVYNPGSPYAFTPQTSMYLDIWVAPFVQPSDQDQILIVGPSFKHRPDLLSQTLYNTPRLWWIFAMLNPDILKDPIFDLQPGIEIRILDESSARAFLR